MTGLIILSLYYIFSVFFTVGLFTEDPKKFKHFDVFLSVFLGWAIFPAAIGMKINENYK